MPMPPVKIPIIDFDPPRYICRKTRMKLGEPDGRLDKPFWEQGEWIEDFKDIEGDSMPRPFKRTQAKLLWDEDNLYVGAKLWDDEIWANVTERDAIIFVDNDFEVFMAPQDSTHRYYELEMNALNTIWDLLMEKPNRDDVRRIMSWDIKGLKSAVHVEGEVNNPAADNRFWSLELVIPWYSLRECESGECQPVHLAPDLGEIWRMNFSRVQWRVEVKDGRYEKCMNPETGKPYPEYNWVWAPTGLIDIHLPELWSFVYFGDEEQSFELPADEQVKWELRKLFYRQRNWIYEHGAYTTSFDDLKGTDVWTIQPSLYATPNLFEISAPASQGTLHVRQDGFLWREA